MKKIKSLPKRSQVKTADTWDLNSLFSDDRQWETEFQRWQKQIAKYDKFRGTLGDDAKTLAACLKFDSAFDRAAERLGTYAMLKTTEDQTSSTYQRMMGRLQSAMSSASQTASYIRPELMAIPKTKMDAFLADRKLKPYRLQLQRMRRFKKHTLSKKEENLLAMQSEMASASNKIFTQLNNSDLKFGNVRDEKGQTVELAHATFGTLMHSPKRAVRKKAFEQYYGQFAAHQNTLAATLAGSIQRDVFNAKARGYDSAISQSLYPDNVPKSVYDNLIESVHRNLPSLYRYFDLRRRKMKLRDLHQYDTYVPILSKVDASHSWRQATRLIISALQPLGSEYCQVLEEGLSGRWCDRYPNVGKQSGAFSCGSFDGDPYILMNYQSKLIDHVFTLAHEAGHSMHSHLSAKHQPYEYYDYTIFVAEVASTFNEQLLSHHLMAKATDRQQRAYLINREIDSIRATIIRQTMFAEFEKIAHAQVEAGEPLTVDAFKSIYRGLLETYFGPDFALDEQLSLECFRIPHFYRAFYVYKYATGLSAAIALSRRVLDGGQSEVDDYLGFLQGGCSKYPLDLLRGAGVDMESPEPVNTALEHFGRLVDELDELL